MGRMKVEFLLIHVPRNLLFSVLRVSAREVHEENFSVRL